MPETQVIVKTEYQKVLVPENLTKDCPLPDIPAEGSPNDILAEYMIRMETALKDCNTDKKSIRLWQTAPPPQTH
ncbi:Rz1-like lysis system protein LysC [Photobacterium damselae]|uniref:Rz1-like lysis system protein LysC n=1 Tax=Photobacterium damselae TaxID=38293 RepID=UPI003B982293